MHTYTSIYIHVVFATWNRHPFLDHATRPRLHAYFAGTARNLGVGEVTVGGVEDHLHFIGRFNPAVAFSSVIGQLKKSSTDWLHETFPHLGKFRWQRGFGGFSVSIDRVPSVIRYIERQEEHHRHRSFHEELDGLLREFGLSIGETGLL
jgi:REP element-mobilizing transposase RayT